MNFVFAGSLAEPSLALIEESLSIVFLGMKRRPQTLFPVERCKIFRRLSGIVYRVIQMEPYVEFCIQNCLHPTFYSIYDQPESR